MVLFHVDHLAATAAILEGARIAAVAAR